MLATVLVSLLLMELPPAGVTEAARAETLAAAGAAHLERARTSAGRPLDELHHAHTKFDAAFMVEGVTAYLCRALAAADLALRTGDFADEQERLSWEETRQDDLDRLREEAARSGRANCRYDARGEPARPRVALLAADDLPSIPAPSPPIAAPAPTVRAPSSRAQLHRDRAHTAMGVVLTSAGIGMLGILAGILELERQRVVEVRGIIKTAAAEQRGYTPAEERRYLDLRDDLIRGRDAAIGVGVAGLVSLGTGVALLATRKKTRPRTYALSPYGGPQGAGAVLRLRF